MKNQLSKTFWLTLMVVGILMAMFFLPRISIGDTMLRRVNLLSDIQQRDSTGRLLAEVEADAREGIVEEVLDSAAVKVEVVAYKDEVPEGMVAIEDYADSEGINREMDHFYAALNEANKRPVRIAYYGDSFIEGDILTMDLRQMLQEKFGGEGVGWVDITHIAAGFRQTVRSNSNGWASHHFTDNKGFRVEEASIAGNYFYPAYTGSLTLTCQDHVYGNRLGSVSNDTIYYSAGDELSMTVATNGGERRVVRGSGEMRGNPGPTYETVYEPTDSVDETGEPVMRAVKVKKDPVVVEPSGRVGSTVLAEKVTGDIRSISFSASGPGRFYGVALDGNKGIQLDNFSSRGSSGMFLGTMPESNMREFAHVRPYDLIVIHFGLNVASAKVKDYTYYTNSMSKGIRHLKAAYPNASILIVSVSDRDQRTSDGLHTMKGVTELLAFQRKMASEEHVAFWNLYDAMGGDGSMARMKEEKMANLDYTHINFKGGKHVAKILFDVLMNGKMNYDKRKGN